MSRVYRIYGIVVRSDWDLPLPELPGGTPEVEIIQCSSAELEPAAAEAATLPDTPEWYKIANLHDGSTYISFPSLFEFLISSDGRRVCVHRRDGIPDDAFHTYLLTHGMSYAMLEMGIEQLHGTCVLIDQRAVAFVGDSGHGKSTLAAAFVRAGYRLISDDMLLVRPGALATVIPALPQIKLFPDVAESLLGQHVQGERMNPLTRKTIIRLAPEQFYRDEAPLECLYVLASPSARASQSAVEIGEISRQDAFIALCKAAFNSDESKSERLKRQFSYASQIVSSVPIKRLSFGDGIDSLDDVRNAVLSDVGSGR
jgi:hypothetical protein